MADHLLDQARGSERRVLSRSASGPIAATLPSLLPRQGWVRRRGSPITVLAVLAVSVLAGYLMLLRCFDEASLPFTASFGDVPAGSRGVRVDVDVTSVDVTGHTLRLRVGVQPVSPEAGAHASQVRGLHAQTAPGPVVTLAFGGEMRIVTGPLPQFLVLSANLTEGGNGAYPFDQQGTELSVAAGEIDAGGRETSVPVVLCLRDALAAYDIRPKRSELTPDMVEVGLQIRRNLTSIVFSCCFYGIMLVIAAATLTVGTLAALRLRKAELPMTTLFATSLFAVPALRNAMPGAPPLGVRADFLVFLWAELGIATGLLLFLVGWLRSSSRGMQAAGPASSASLPGVLSTG